MQIKIKSKRGGSAGTTSTSTMDVDTLSNLEMMYLRARVRDMWQQLGEPRPCSHAGMTTQLWDRFSSGARMGSVYAEFALILKIIEALGLKVQLISSEYGCSSYHGNLNRKGV